MNQEELTKILQMHALWLNYSGGARANLHGADLRGTNLRGTNLRWANLCGANLHEANLREADLRGADLRGADLREADLRGADLRYANLRGAKLRGANLRDADLHDATIKWCIGNGTVIRTLQTPQYTIVIRDDLICIGCEAHRAHEWAAFSDAHIENMDPGAALTWWRANRTLVFAFLDADSNATGEYAV